MSYDAAGAHFGQPGYETDLLYIAGLLALCVGGPGPLSISTRAPGEFDWAIGEERGDSTDRHLSLNIGGYGNNGAFFARRANLEKVSEL